MSPIAKGTVEGKNSELKRVRPSRFDLPGRFKKARERRQPDGKKNAALDIHEFERILVEIIMDINGEPIEPRRIPPDALQHGASIASRIGFHEWALKNRAGFTRKMNPNFVYEHLLNKSRGIVSPLGIKLANELFNCDRLRETGYLMAAVSAHIEIVVSYNPNYAGEVFFFDSANDAWIAAHNVDPEIVHLRMTFAEAKEYRALQTLLTEQAGFDNHARRRSRLPVVREEVLSAVAEKTSLGVRTSATNANIRKNRSREKASQRSAGLNGALERSFSIAPEPASASPWPTAVPTAMPGQAAPRRPATSPSATDAFSLWDQDDSGSDR